MKNAQWHFNIKFYNYPKLVFWRILTNLSYNLSFYLYQKPNHRTQFTTALRDVKEAFRRGQGSTDSPRSDRDSPWSRVPLDTKHNKYSLSFRCKGATIRLPGGGLGFVGKIYSGSGFGQTKFWPWPCVKKISWLNPLKKKCLPSIHEKEMSALYPWKENVCPQYTWK